jgi:hypothetical protein
MGVKFAMIILPSAHLMYEFKSLTLIFMFSLVNYFPCYILFTSTEQ